MFDNLFSSKEGMKIGDWIKSYSVGIWQIYKILKYKVCDPASGKIEDKVTVFSKRFINKSYKKSFSEECCSPAFVKPLPDEELKLLNAFIKENPLLHEKFKEYVPKELDSIYNAKIKIPEDKNVKKVESLIHKDVLLTDVEINPYLEKLGLTTNSKHYGWTAQFVSKGFSVKDGHLGYGFERILKF